MLSKDDLARKKQIEDARAQTGVSKLKYGASIPRWLRRKIKAALQANGVTARGYFSVGACWIWFHHFLATCDGKTSFIAADGTAFNVFPCNGYGRIFDHAGTTKIDDELCFVMEPYKQKDIEKYEQELTTVTYTLSRILGCMVTWSSVSWHYPGQTYRILFEEE